MTTLFRKLNDGWNADPNAPHPRVSADLGEVTLSFGANPFEFPQFTLGQRLVLRFKKAARYRLGPTNDEGWYRGQCRFSGLPPEWGEFYEVSGDLRLNPGPGDWMAVAPVALEGLRHFLFYLRDNTFECSAADWALEILPPPVNPSATSS